MTVTFTFRSHPTDASRILNSSLFLNSNSTLFFPTQENLRMEEESDIIKAMVWIQVNLQGVTQLQISVLYLAWVSDSLQQLLNLSASVYGGTVANSCCYLHSFSFLSSLKWKNPYMECWRACMH